MIFRFESPPRPPPPQGSRKTPPRGIAF